MSDQFDAAWFSERLQRRVRRVVSYSDMSHAGGLSASIGRVCLEMNDGKEEGYVVKCTKPGKEASSQLFGKAREGLFFSHLAATTTTTTRDDASHFLPQIAHAEGNMTDGSYTIVMEDLTQSTVQAGHFFGSGSPCNWGHLNEEAMQRAARQFPRWTPKLVTLVAFRAAAQLHASYWQRRELLSQSPWLRGVGWLQGQDRCTWVAAQERSRTAFQTILETRKKTHDDDKEAGDTSLVQWDPAVIALLHAAQAKVNWQDYQEELRNRPWTLVHGDFHPANMLLMASGVPEKADPKIVFLDFEMVGVGSGPQDLGQFMISHVDPSTRVAMEQNAVQVYYEELITAYNRNKAQQEHGVETGNGSFDTPLSWEKCWEEYTKGGLARWLWFLPVLASVCPPPAAQYFHDQVLAFATTHGIHPTNVPMPRV